VIPRCYLGLAPREYSPGEHQQRGRVLRSAQPAVQALLVQAAWRVCRRPIRVRRPSGRGRSGSSAAAGRRLQLSPSLVAWRASYMPCGATARTMPPIASTRTRQWSAGYARRPRVRRGTAWMSEVVKLEEPARNTTWPRLRGVTKTAPLLLEYSRAPGPHGCPSPSANRSVNHLAVAGEAETLDGSYTTVARIPRRRACTTRTSPRYSRCVLHRGALRAHRGDLTGRFIEVVLGSACPAPQ